MLTLEEQLLYLPTAEELNMAVSTSTPPVPPTPTPTVSTAPTSPAQTLEERVTELETVVHTLAAYSRAHEQGVIVAWLAKVGARVQAAVKKVV